jgi:hypothetical protein
VPSKKACFLTSRPHLSRKGTFFLTFQFPSCDDNIAVLKRGCFSHISCSPFLLGRIGFSLSLPLIWVSDRPLSFQSAYIT